jgi:hypothetical protein
MKAEPAWQMDTSRNAELRPGVAQIADDAIVAGARSIEDDPAQLEDRPSFSLALLEWDDVLAHGPPLDAFTQKIFFAL